MIVMMSITLMKAISRFLQVGRVITVPWCDDILSSLKIWYRSLNPIFHRHENTWGTGYGNVFGTKHSGWAADYFSLAAWWFLSVVYGSRKTVVLGTMGIMLLICLIPTVMSIFGTNKTHGKKSRADVNFLFGTGGKVIDGLFGKDIIMTLGSMETLVWRFPGDLLYSKRKKGTMLNDKKKMCLSIGHKNPVQTLFALQSHMQIWKIKFLAWPVCTQKSQKSATKPSMYWTFRRGKPRIHQPPLVHR